MKKNTIRISGLLLTLGLLSSFLLACEQKSGFRFINENNGQYWGRDFYDYGDYDDYDDDDYAYSYSYNYGSSNNGGNNGDGNGTTDETFDENSTKFGHSFSGTAAGEVAIYAKPDNCKDDNLIVPSTYVDSKGNRYQVALDCNNGFNALSATSITLPDGFKKIVEGFDNCFYLKKIYLPKSIESIADDTIVSCLALEKIDFKGTKAEWNTINKGDRWNYQAPALIISCSDGMIEMQSWAESHPSD